MPARDESLLHAVDVINAGSSLDIVGEHGSGRSHLLDRIGEYFSGRGLSVVRVSGSSAFQSTPMAALGWLGLNVSSLQVAFAEFTALLGKDRRAVILVDDWDDVDDISWGVISRVRMETGTPIVSARVSGTGRQRPFSATGFTHVYQLRLQPLRMNELERALVDDYDQQIDPSTMSELYAAAGGNVGLTKALYEAAIRDGTLRADDEGVVASVGGHLWTSSMAVIVEHILRPLPRALRDALETLAVLGPATFDAAVLATDRESLESLADLGFVESYAAGTLQVVAIRQPLILAYFRHETSNIRRKLIADDLRDVLSASALPTPVNGGEHAALFVALIHEYERRRLDEAREAWDRARSLDTAANLLMALGRSGGTESEIPQILRESNGLPGTPAGIVAWDTWYASYVALVKAQPEEAVTWLEDRAKAAPESAPALRLHRALVQTMAISPPDLSQLPREEEFSPADAWQVRQARALVLLTTGNVAPALEIIMSVKEEVTNSLVDLVAVVALTADGQYTLARQIAAGGLAHAAEAFDPGELYRYAYMASFAAFVSSQSGEAEEIIGMVSQLAAPVDEGLTHLGVQAIAVSIASRRGGVSTDAPGDTVVAIDGALPGMQKEWIEAEELRAGGDVSGAADMLDAVGDTLWERGARLAAAYAYLAAAGSDLDPKRLERLETRVSEVGGNGIARYRLLNIARITKDLDGMVEGVQRAESARLWEMSLLVWGEIAELSAERGDAVLAAHARTQASRIRADFEGTGVTSVLRRLPNNLTDREREIARLAASGLANSEIGQMLFVSTRTVESHLNRVMKKAGVQTRQELRELYRNRP